MIFSYIAMNKKIQIMKKTMINKSENNLKIVELRTFYLNKISGLFIWFSIHLIKSIRIILDVSYIASSETVYVIAQNNAYNPGSNYNKCSIIGFFI